MLLSVPRRRDEETGEYELSYTDETILQLLRGTRLSTSEVAEELDCHRTTAHARLVELENKGDVISSKAGNTFIWEIT